MSDPTPEPATPPTPEPTSSNPIRRVNTRLTLAAMAAVAVGLAAGVVVANLRHEPPPNPALDPLRAVYALLDGYNRADPQAVRRSTCGSLAEADADKPDEQLGAELQADLDEFGVSWLVEKPMLTFNPAGDAVKVSTLVVHEKTEHVEYHVGLPGLYGYFNLENADGDWKVCHYELH